MTRTSLRSFLTITTLASAAFATLLVCAAIARADYTVSSCGGYPNEGVFSALLPPGGSVITSGSVCPSSGQGLVLQSSSSVNSSMGKRGAWSANAPAGLEIVAASVAPPGITASSMNISGSPWGGGVYWAGGTQDIPTEYDGGGSWSGFVSPYFGFQLACDASTCGEAHGAELQINGTVNFSSSRDCRPVAECPERAVAKPGVGPRPVAPVLLGRLAVGDVCPQRVDQSDSVHRNELAARCSDLAPVLGSAGERHDQHGCLRLRGDAAVHRRLRRGRGRSPSTPRRSMSTTARRRCRSAARRMRRPQPARSTSPRALVAARQGSPGSRARSTAQRPTGTPTPTAAAPASRSRSADSESIRSAATPSTPPRMRTARTPNPRRRPGR